jgi:hypothetical protein
MRRIAALSDETKVASVAAFCLMALAVVLKNVLHVPAAELSRNIVMMLVVYSGFWLLPLVSGKREKKSVFETPLSLSLMIVALTLAIITVYAV